MLRRFAFRRNALSICILIVSAFICIFVVYSLIVRCSSTIDVYRQSIESRMSQMQTLIDQLKAIDRDKTRAFVDLRSQIQYIGSIDYRNASLFGNFSNLHSSDLSLPDIYDFLPHLATKSERELSPALTASSIDRRNMFMVIGIPSIKRKVSYLMTTLRSLIDNLAPADRESILFVVMLADMDGAESEFVRTTMIDIRNEFGKFIDTGMLQVIVPPAAFYPPDLKFLTPTFGDTSERMFWRTKQNLDYIYLMLYCQSHGRYYMQLEDDVITKPAYIARIRDFISQKSEHLPAWLLLEFSSLGFIGKLFKSADIPLITQFILMFHRDKPVDWLLDLVFMVRYCSPEKSTKHCRQLINTQYRHRLKPSLFQHIGMQSSLDGKVQKLKEKDFGKQQLHTPHLDNPNARLTTSLRAYQSYTLEKAYRGESFFWSLLPQANDFIQIDFDPPIRLESFLIRSGNIEHPNDRFTNATVLVKYVTDISSSVSPTGTGDYHPITVFTSSGNAQSDLDPQRITSALRIVVNSESESWLIISEIWIKPVTVR